MPKSRYQKLKDKADKLTSEYIRRKASDHRGYATCVTCGTTKHWKELQAGHYLSRKYNAGRFLEENIHPQCQGCNIFKNGAYQEYTLYLIDMYGRDFVDELMSKKHDTVKFTVADLEDMIKDLEKRINDL